MLNHLYFPAYTQQMEETFHMTVYTNATLRYFKTDKFVVRL